MKTIGEITKTLITEIQEQPTKVVQVNTAEQIEKGMRLFKRRTAYRITNPDQQRMFDAAASFASQINYRKAYWLSLLGGSGIGKTHLAREIYRQFMDWSRFQIGFDADRQRIVGNTGQFCDWRQFCSDLRGGSFGRIDDLCEDSFVILDDIGSEHDPNGFIASALDRIVNERSKGACPKWTVITCNFYLDQIAERIDQRIADRMLRNGSVVIESNFESFSLA